MAFIFFPLFLPLSLYFKKVKRNGTFSVSLLKNTQCTYLENRKLWKESLEHGNLNFTTYVITTHTLAHTNTRRYTKKIGIITLGLAKFPVSLIMKLSTKKYTKKISNFFDIQNYFQIFLSLLSYKLLIDISIRILTTWHMACICQLL